MPVVPLTASKCFSALHCAERSLSHPSRFTVNFMQKGSWFTVQQRFHPCAVLLFHARADVPAAEVRLSAEVYASTFKYEDTGNERFDHIAKQTHA